MKVAHDFSVPPAELFTTLVDPAYLAARQERFGGIGEPTVEPEGDATVITARRQLPLDKIPGAFRGFVGDGQIVQVDTWQSPAAGTWSATVGTAPATIGGTHEISASDSGCHYAIGIEVSIKIPLIGGKFEQQVSGYLEHLINKELDYLDEWIGSQ